MDADGFIEVWRKRFEHRGIPYEIALLRYYNKQNPSVRLNRIGKHAVLEYTEESKPLHDFVEDVFGDYTWLWDDTLHYGMRDWDEEQMIEYLHGEAKDDIDWLLDKGEITLLNRIEELKKRIKELKKLTRRRS